MGIRAGGFFVISKEKGRGEKMEELKAEQFECIKEENSDEEDKRQWERSVVVFDTYYHYSLDRGLKEGTAGKRTNGVAFFIMDYLFVYDDALGSMLEVSGDTVRTFLGNWYIRKFRTPKMSEISVFLAAIYDFYKFIEKKGFIDKGRLEDIKEACGDKDWFKMRLKTYSESDCDDLYEWIQEYNYDWF